MTRTSLIIALGIVILATILSVICCISYFSSGNIAIGIGYIFPVVVGIFAVLFLIECWEDTA